MEAKQKNTAWVVPGVSDNRSLPFLFHFLVSLAVETPVVTPNPTPPAESTPFVTPPSSADSSRNEDDSEANIGEETSFSQNIEFHSTSPVKSSQVGNSLSHFARYLRLSLLLLTFILCSYAIIFCFSTTAYFVAPSFLPISFGR